MACNADMGPAEVREHCQVDNTGKSLLRVAMQQLQMSARAYHRILKLARTIADLAGSAGIEGPHVAEAIQYRRGRSSDASIWHINADEPSVLDYNTEYKSAGQGFGLYAADEYRSSDHDPVIVDLNLRMERIYLPVVMRSYPQP